MKLPSRVIYIVFICLFRASNGARIFLISNLASGSHALWYGKLANLLDRRGHEVVMLGTGPFKSESSNVTFVLIEDAYKWLETFEQVIGETSLQEFVGEFSSPTENMKITSDWPLNECGNWLKSKGTQSFIEKYKKEQFDLIITDFICDSFLGFVHFFNNPPFVIATPYTNAFSVFDSVGLFDNPSYVPVAFTPFHPEMNFIERIYNAYYKLYSMYIWRRYNIPKEDALAKKVFGDSTPYLPDILNNVSLLLLGADSVLTGAKPLPPAYIPVGGFHINKIKPLPQKMKKFIDDAKEGVIYFNFGSNFKSVFMKPEMIRMFMDVFQETPQRIVWKLELDNLTSIPNNVLIAKWLPQNDILGHSNVRCFISHGGLLGIQEAIYHGVPVLAFPFMFDQHDIAEKLNYNRVGIKMEFTKLSKEYIKDNLDRILHPSYGKRMKEWSRMFKDSPQTPEDRAIWWIEYVLRNPTETRKYLRSSSMNLYWFQRLMLDVFAAVLLSLLVIVTLLYYLMKTILVMCCGKKRTSRNNKNKKD